MRKVIYTQKLILFNKSYNFMIVYLKLHLYIHLHVFYTHTHVCVCTSRVKMIIYLTRHRTKGIFYFIVFFLWPHLQHVEGSSQARGWIGAVAVAFATATATQDLSRICLCQLWICNPLSKDRDQTCILRDNVRSLTCWATRGTLKVLY